MQEKPEADEGEGSCHQVAVASVLTPANGTQAQRQEQGYGDQQDVEHAASLLGVGQRGRASWRFSPSQR